MVDIEVGRVRLRLPGSLLKLVLGGGRAHAAQQAHG